MAPNAIHSSEHTKSTRDSAQRSAVGTPLSAFTSKASFSLRSVAKNAERAKTGASARCTAAWRWSSHTARRWNPQKKRRIMRQMRGFRYSIADDQSVFITKETPEDVGYSRANPAVIEELADSPSSTCDNDFNETPDDDETPTGWAGGEIAPKPEQIEFETANTR